MFQMSNLKSREAYRRKETIINYAHNGYILLVAIWYVFDIIIRFEDLEEKKHIPIMEPYGFLICRISELMALIGTGGTLLYQLKSKYHFAYNC
jgi:hypothetical protein